MWIEQHPWKWDQTIWHWVKNSKIRKNGVSWAFLHKKYLYTIQENEWNNESWNRKYENINRGVPPLLNYFLNETNHNLLDLHQNELIYSNWEVFFVSASKTCKYACRLVYKTDRTFIWSIPKFLQAWTCLSKDSLTREYSYWLHKRKCYFLQN